eukprot:215578_1
MSETSIWKSFVKSKYATKLGNKAVEPIPAILFGAMGLVGILQPQFMSDIVGYNSILPNEGRNEIRAVYGGFGLFTCGVLFFTNNTNLEIGAKFTVAMALAGMATGRAISFIIDKEIKTTSLIYLCSEYTLAALILQGFANQTLIKQIKSL